MCKGNTDTKKTALKLHKQFGHPSPDKLLDLLGKAKMKTSDLEKSITDISEQCDICRKYKKARPKPVVCMPLASKFNDVVAMDLKVFGSCYFLVIVDLATRFCSARVIKDKKAQTIIKALCLTWICYFGAPCKILSDNGGEFNNIEMRELGEAFNIKIITTAAESPWSNGVCERLNSVLASSVEKIIADNNCGVDVALAWAVSARNALANFSGFSPNQMVFGKNPALPNVFDNEIPAMNPVESSDTVRENLNAMHSAREQFIKAESSERVRRALRHNVRSSDVDDIRNGDEVLYKRNDSKEWHGPGTVIGRDGKLILVRHGGIYVRVHECRLLRSPLKKPKEVSNVEDESSNKEKSVVAESELASDEDDDLCDNFANKISKEKDNVPQMDLVGESANGAEVSTIGKQNTTDNSMTESSVPCFKVGQRVQGVCTSTGERISGKIVGRAGKATGKYKHCFNIRQDKDNSVSWFDMKKDFSEIDVVPDSVELVLLFNSEEVLSAK
ncbi:MAG: transposase family protein, partial [Bacteroidota bacterium]